MATSLAEQLNRLKVPQTSVLIDSKKRASILFDLKEAATKDRQTIFELGKSGITELILLNPAFIQFEKTLFDESSINLERSVEDRKVNKLLNEAIKKFFHHLSPYFMLQPSHLCLEWLVRRFHIHNFNRNEFVDLILPYHETKIFVKCLQIMNFNEQNSKWLWLEPVRKAGVPLSKNALQNRAAGDTAFLNSICESTLESIKELGTRSNTLQTRINFYCITIIGALEKAKKVNESHISCLLRPILKGFASNSLDFAASSFMITAQLLSKVNLKNEVLKSIIAKICIVEFKSLQTDILLLLILICQRQNITDFPDELLINFISKKSVINNINELSNRKVKVSSLCAPLIRGCFIKIHSKDEEWVKCRDFITNLIDDVRFQENEITNIIRTILESNQNPMKIYSADEVVELDSDEENELLQEDIKLIYSNCLHQLERQYPVAFDVVVKEIMQGQNNISERRKQALKSILAFRLKSSYSEDCSSIYENLYSPSSVNRISAIRFLIKNFETLTMTEEAKAMIRDSLMDRLNDDDQDVLKEVLSISSDKFSKIMDNRIFLEKLIVIFHKCHLETDDWSLIKSKVIEHITSLEIVKVCDANIILLTLLPLIVSDQKSDVELLKSIAKKDFIKFIPFLKELFSLNLGKNLSTIKDFDKVIQNIQSIPKPESILNSFDKIDENFYKNSVNSSFILLFLGQSFSKYENTDIKYKLKAFEMFKTIQKNMKFVSQSNLHLKNIKPNKICLTIVLNYLLSLIKGIKVGTENFVDDSEDSVLFKNIFHEILTRSFCSSEITAKEEYGLSLKELLEQSFASTTKKIDYLAHYFIYDKLYESTADYETQIRSIKLFNCILNGKRKDFSISRRTLIKIILGLGSFESVIRQLTLETLNNIVKLKAVVDENDMSIILRILESHQEILMDEIQVTIVFYSIIFPNNNTEKIRARQFLNSLLEILKDDDVEIFLKAVLLNVIKLANNSNILNNLIELGCKTMEEVKLKTYEKSIGCDNYSSEILKKIAERFDSETISILSKNKKAWQFIEESLKNHAIILHMDGKFQSISCFLMDVFEPETYDKMTALYKKKFLNCVLESMVIAEDNTIPITGSKLIKRLKLNGNQIKNILEEMKDICSNKDPANRRKSITSNVNSLNSIQWKIGITLLELLQNINTIQSFEILIPILFDLLKTCLEFEEQIALDYAKQLILSCLINLCQRIHEFDNKTITKLKDNGLKMDLVVQCIRSTQNPQTHHHALMLLSKCAYIIPHKVLHNITNVFTFMGSSVVRHDDSFSFQIIFNLIESVIPMLVDACSEDIKLNTDNRDKKVIPILKVFSDIILDVPEHRRLLLYSKLIKTLNAQQYLWMFLCIIFESHVVNDEKERKNKTKNINRQSHSNRSVSPEELPKRLSIALQICKVFEPTILIETCISLFDHLKKLPEQKPDEQTNMSVDEQEIETSIFEINSHTEKQLRHYKFSILQFMSSLTSSTDFGNSIATLSDEELKGMKIYYQNFIIKILSFIPSVTIALDKNLETNQFKFWKIILHHCTDILDNAISLLSADMLLVVVHGLLQHQIPIVRRKVIELLIAKLQYNTEYFKKSNEDNMIMLLEPLKNIISSILDKEVLAGNQISNNEEIIIKHLALIAIKLLSRSLALKRVDEFKEILNLLSKILKKKEYVSKIITAAVVLAISEISSNLKAHSISNLYKFMPLMIDVLNDQTEEIEKQTPDNISIAILTAIYKLFDSLALFMGPYYSDIFTLLTKIWTRLDSKISDNRISTMYTKLNSIWTKISTAIPLRLLTPHCEKVYTKLLEEKNYKGVIYLMKLLNESFNNTEGSDINNLQNDLTKFFLVVLDFRCNLQNGLNDMSEIKEIESEILQTFVSLILKLSESSFRPLYQKLYDWALRNSDQYNEKSTDRAITYFSLSGAIAEALKSLFVLFASDFIQDAANLLVKCNDKVEQNNEESIREKIKNSEKCVVLLESILDTLYKIFLYDTQGFTNAHRFDILMQPITDQIENPLIIQNTNLQTILINCISQLAFVVSNDVLWKQLNYQILLKSRNEKPEIKILSLNICVETAKKLGEDFSSLLPETIPFLAELLEDENQNVEKSTRKAVQELEKVLGESLQKYF